MCPKSILPRHSLPWKLTSGTLKLATTLLTKIVLRTTQRVQTKNLDRLLTAIHHRPRDKALVTVSNHASCLDDPVIWGVLPAATCVSNKRMRWTPAASEFVFTNPLFSWFFSRIHLVPITRGLGVYQRGLDFCINLVNEGSWVHFFPEGKINMSLDPLRLKWGIGRMLAEAANIPTVIPLWHVGMDDILPNRAPYIPRIFKKLTILVGEPIDISTLLRSQESVGGNAVVMRKLLTDMVQHKLYELKSQADALHQEWTVHSPVAYRTL